MPLKVKQNFMANGVTGQVGKHLSEEEIKKLGPDLNQLKSDGMVEESTDEKDAAKPNTNPGQTGQPGQAGQAQHSGLETAPPTPHDLTGAEIVEKENQENHQEEGHKKKR